MSTARPDQPVAPPAPDLRKQVQESLARGDAAAALGGLAMLWAREPGPATAGFINTTFEKVKPAAAVPCRVAFLRSFTVEPIVPLLRAGAAVSGIDVSAWVGDFNTYQQEGIDPASRLYAFDRRVIVLA